MKIAQEIRVIVAKRRVKQVPARRQPQVSNRKVLKINVVDLPITHCLAGKIGAVNMQDRREVM